MQNPFSKIPERNKLLLLSLVVGITSGLAAVLLRWLIDVIKDFANGEFISSAFNWQYLVLPGLGVLISMLLVRYLIRDNIGHGVTKALLAVSRNESRIKPHNTWSSILTSSITIGFGGSVGAEAPIVYTGAAIGSNLGRISGLSHRSVTTLLGCGAAGAVAGIFKAPLAGVLFTMEILMFNLSLKTMLPMLISSISATVVAYIFCGQNPSFACTLTTFSIGNIPFYIILGVVGAFAALYFTRTTLWLEDKFSKFENAYLKWVLCAVALGLLIFLFPPLYGEGYDSMLALLNGHEISLESGSLLSFLMAYPWGIVIFFVFVFFAKVLAMTLTNAGGGVGGTFGPTLFSGAILGFAVARSLNLLGAGVPEQNFVLVGMAALMASVMQAPMTAIFLIAEISGGYELLIPLIITATISFGVSRMIEPYSIYTKRIAKKGELLTHDSDQAVLTLLKTSDLIESNFTPVAIDATLGELVEAVAISTRNIFPVLDSQGRFQGFVSLEDIRRDMFKKEEYDALHVFNFMKSSPEYVYVDEKMDSVMKKFEKTDAWNLPVVDENRVYVGFVSKSKIFSAYRAQLKVVSHE